MVLSSNPATDDTLNLLLVNSMLHHSTTVVLSSNLATDDTLNYPMLPLNLLAVNSILHHSATVVLHPVEPLYILVLLVSSDSLFSPD